MADVHIPKLEGHETEKEGTSVTSGSSTGKALSKVALEVVLISLGVFLGLMGEQWREHSHRRELAQVALRRLHSEIEANRNAVNKVKNYHVTLKKGIEDYIAATDKNSARPHMKGLQPVNFEHAAWDLAMATQSFAEIEPDIAFDISHVYTTQQTYSSLTQNILQTLYLRPPNEDLERFFKSAVIYFDDIVIYEPRLLTMYDEALSKIDRALGEPAAAPK